MRFHVLLQITFTLLVLVTTATFTIAKSTAETRSTVSTASTVTIDDGVNYKRRLRESSTIKTEDDDGSALDSTVSEDRGIFSSIGSKLKSAKEKSLNASKKKLGMGGLSGAALKNHKNYKNFQKFKYQKEGSILDNYVYKDVPTFDVWTKLGLDKLPKNKIQTAPEYRTYERYVNKYADDYLWFPGDHKLKFTGTPEEKTAKAEIWAKKRRPKYMVKEMLGLKDMKKKERQNDPDYEYYALFLKLSGEK